MRRRSILSLGGVGLTALLPGCSVLGGGSGGDGDATSTTGTKTPGDSLEGVEIQSTVAKITGDGSVKLEVTMTNGTEEKISGTLHGTVDVKDGKTYEQEKPIDLSSGGFRIFDMLFRTDLPDSADKSSFTYEVRFERDEG